MFQYTKETVLNSLPEVEKLTGGAVLIKGVGEYTPANMGDVYITMGEYGEPSTLTLPAATLKGEKILTFRVVTSQVLAEFATPNWNVFGKPIIVGYNTEDVDELVKAIELAIPECNKFITVKKDATGANIVITGATNYITFDKVAVEDANGVTVIAKTAVKANVEPFATKEWIIENLRFPTYSNIRYASANTMPTADLYAEFAFDYTVVREGLGGLSGVGQGLTATTKHIIYVPADKAAEFKSALTTAGITKYSATNAESATTPDEPYVEPETEE